MSAQPIETPRAAKMRIIAETAQEFGVTVDDIMGRSRHMMPVSARHAAMRRVAAAFPEMTLNQIAALFGRSEHTQILYALGRTKASKAATQASRARLNPSITPGWRETVSRIVKDVSTQTWVLPEEIISNSRRVDAIAARREVAARLHQHYPSATRRDLARITGLYPTLGGYDMKSNAGAAE